MRRTTVTTGVWMTLAVAGAAGLTYAAGPATKPTTAPTLAGGPTLSSKDAPAAEAARKPELVAPNSGTSGGSGGGAATIQVGGGVNVGQAAGHPGNQPRAEGHAAVPPTTKPSK